MQQHVTSVTGEDDDQIHQYKDEVVVPAIGLLTPEAGVPDKNLLLDCAQHDQDQSHRSKLGKHAEGYAQASASSAAPRKAVKLLLMPMLLLRSSGFLRWLQPLWTKTMPTMILSRSSPQSANLK